MAAVGNGFVDCANLLLNEGANILAVDMYHRSALHRAVSNVARTCRFILDRHSLYYWGTLFIA